MVKNGDTIQVIQFERNEYYSGQQMLPWINRYHMKINILPSLKTTSIRYQNISTLTKYWDSYLKLVLREKSNFTQL